MAYLTLYNDMPLKYLNLTFVFVKILTNHQGICMPNNG